MNEADSLGSRRGGGGGSIWERMRRRETVVLGMGGRWVGVCRADPPTRCPGECARLLGGHGFEVGLLAQRNAFLQPLSGQT